MRWSRTARYDPLPPCKTGRASDLAQGAPRTFRNVRIGALPGSLVPHFFDTLARSGRLGIHISAAGADDHHMLEASFKALARALRAAVAVDPGRAGEIPSTKGSL